MDSKSKTMIVTGASRGIGAGVTEAFLERGYNVVANSFKITQYKLKRSANLVLVEGDVSQPSTAAKIVDAAVSQFGSIDGVINNAGIFFTKPFTDFTTVEVGQLAGTNLLGYIYVTQLAVKQMLAQGSGGSVIGISSVMVDHPIAGVNASIPMVTKGGIEALTRSLAMEYVKEGIRFNAVAPGIVNTPMHPPDSHAFLKTLSPMGEISEISDIVEAILYLTDARHVTGEVLHVDAGGHNGKW
jgi:NAD(P)-dependent dehydrogenase (short-subunit alcohol dehydrogenase family)